jgi:hypothetical protein
MSTKLLLSIALVVCSITFGITGCQKPEEPKQEKVTRPPAGTVPGGMPETKPAEKATPAATPAQTPAAPATGAATTTTTATPAQ